LRRKARNYVDHEHSERGKIAYPEEVDDKEDLDQEEEDGSVAVAIRVAGRVGFAISVAIGIAVTHQPM
jgi:hypothetical protein